MNQHHYSPLPSEPLVKHRRGRPRKEDSMSHLSKLPPIKPPTSMGTQIFILNQINQSQSSIEPFQPQVDLSKGKARVEDTTSNGCGIRDDQMIGKSVTGVLDGKFDAGYLLTAVKVGDNDALMKGLVFQPGKFMHVTKDNDIAPGVKMYTRVGQACVDSSVGVSVEEVKVVELEEADKELNPIAVLPENSNVVVPHVAFMESEEQNVVIPEKNNLGLERQGDKVVVEEHFGSPSLELALSNTSFVDTQVQADVSKPVVEDLEPSLDSSLMKDELKVSMGVEKDSNTDAEINKNENKVADLPIVVPPVRFHEEIEGGEEVSMLARVAKKHKVDEKCSSK